MVCVHSCVSDLGDCGLWVGHGCCTRDSLCSFLCCCPLCCWSHKNVFWYIVGTLVMQLGRPMWRRVSCAQQLNRMSDLSRKLKCFGHAVVEPCCVRTLAQSTVFLSVVSSIQFVCPSLVFRAHSCCVRHSTRHRHGSRLKALQGSKVILSVAPVSTCLLITTFVIGLWS